MADVVCDTSFLMHLATRRVRNIDRIYQEVGDVSFVVPGVVVEELRRISGHGGARGRDAARTLEFAGSLEALGTGGRSGDGHGGGDGSNSDDGAAHADDVILDYASARGSIVATMDKNLKRRLKEAGCAVVSFSNDNVILES